MPVGRSARRGDISTAPRVAAADDVQTVLLLAPYAPRGGGMGRMMHYLAEHGAVGSGPVTIFRTIETRGSMAAIFSAWHGFAAAIRIMAHAWRGGRTIVHVNMAEGSSVFRKGLLLLLARGLGMPTVLHLHAADIIRFYAGLVGPARALMRAIFRRADVCIVLGRMWRGWLQDELGVDPARIEILRNGVPDPGIVAFPAAVATPLLVFLGNLLPRKGLPDLIQALSSAPLRNRAWELVVAGGGDSSALRYQIENAGLGGRIRFAGWLDRAAVSALLARSAMVVLPSYLEALPLVLLEAASLGVPAIATRTGAIPEVFCDAETAILVGPGDIGALGDAIGRMIDDPATRTRIGRNARALYERALSIDIFRARLLGIYQRHCLTPGGFMRAASVPSGEAEKVRQAVLF